MGTKVMDQKLASRSSGPPSRFRRHLVQATLRQGASQDGTIVVIFAAVLLVMIGFGGLAMETGQLYNRRVEIQTMVDAAALAAAKQLNGTATGITNAVTAASDRLINTDDGITYKYGQAHADWTDSVIQFAQSQDGPWLDSTTAGGNPQNLKFVKVDTQELDSNVTRLQTIFMRALSAAFDTVTVGTRAMPGHIR